MTQDYSKGRTARSSSTSGPDINIRNEGTILLLSGASDEGTGWLDDHLPKPNDWEPEGWHVVEHRYVADIVHGAINDGLTVVQV